MAILQSKQQDTGKDRQSDQSEKYRLYVGGGKGHGRQRNPTDNTAFSLPEKRQKQKQGRSTVKQPENKAVHTDHFLLSLLLSDGQYCFARKEIIQGYGKAF